MRKPTNMEALKRMWQKLKDVIRRLFGKSGEPRPQGGGGPGEEQK